MLAGMRLGSAVRCLTLLVFTSCLARGAEQRYTQRIAEIDAQYARAIRQLDEADQQAALDLESLERQLVPVVAASRVQAMEPVGEQDALEDLRVACEAINAASVDAREAYAKCIVRYRNRFWSELVNHYWAADTQWIANQIRDADTFDGDESLFVFSHNARLKRYVHLKQVELDERYRESKVNIQRVRMTLREYARRARDAEIQEAYRQFGQILAAAAQGFLGAGASGRTGQTSSDPFRQCRSDSECGLGFMCVKANYSGQGTCARKVDEYGLPIFSLPRMDSVFTKVPSDADCRFDADCPIGFRCSQSSGACFK
jgi:hypothetical protein